MHILLLTFLTASLAVISGNKVESEEPRWIALDPSNDNKKFPESPLIENSSGETTTVAYTSDDVGNDVQLKQESDEYDYTPGYCRCTNRYNCKGANYVQLRSRRAINTPPCSGRHEVMCCLTNGPGCGVPADFPYFNPYPLYGEANFGDHPWLALVMDEDGKAIYGHGIIVAWRLVITSARNVASYRPKRFKVRLGEWDLRNDDEPFKALDYDVSEVIVHPKYDPRTFQNDIALLKLKTDVDLSSFPNIRSACLTRPYDDDRLRNAKCLIAGWGSEPSKLRKIRDANTSILGNYSKTLATRNILKEVDMRIYDQNECQDAIRKAIKNPEYYLDQESFFCAGGEDGKGLCKGDEGTALVCKMGRSPRYTVVGMTSWGTTCGEKGFPTVFTNMKNYYNWIKSEAPDIQQI